MLDVVVGGTKLKKVYNILCSAIERCGFCGPCGFQDLRCPAEILDNGYNLAQAYEKRMTAAYAKARIQRGLS
jgi:formate hydrogenlyase subunit 6/NADH:ubiquinone oxidoreductase subunit I